MWWWVLIWVLLALSALAYLATRAWGVWGQVKELGVEIGRASETVAALQAQGDRLGDPPPPVQPAIFDDPRQLRREREATRDSLKQQRRARQASRRPAWARHLD